MQRSRRPGRRGLRPGRLAARVALTLGLMASAAEAQTNLPPGAAASAPADSSAALDQGLKDLFAHPTPEPEVFGYVSVDVASTPFEADWRGALSRGAPAGNAEVEAVARRLAALPARARVDQANRWINARLAYASDMDVYGVPDHWAGLAEALAHGRGDCEDFAIAKMQLLAAAGTPASDMYMTLVRDLRRQADHAVLVVRVGEDAYVLDSDEDTMLEPDELQRFRPVMAFSEDGRWIFGRRTPEAEVQMVAAVPDLPGEAAAAAAFTPGGR